MFLLTFSTFSTLFVTVFVQFRLFSTFSTLFVTVFVQYNSFDSSVTHKRSFLLLHSTGADLGDLLGDRGSGAAEGSGFEECRHEALGHLSVPLPRGERERAADWRQLSGRARTLPYLKALLAEQRCGRRDSDGRSQPSIAPPPMHIGWVQLDVPGWVQYRSPT